MKRTLASAMCSVSSTALSALHRPCPSSPRTAMFLTKIKQVNCWAEIVYIIFILFVTQIYPQSYYSKHIVLKVTLVEGILTHVRDFLITR